MPAIENQTLSKLYYSIGEVAGMLQVNASLLRFWEKEFKLTVSKKNNKGNRLFSVKEIEQIKRIFQLVKVEGYTLEGAKKALKQKAPSSVLEQLQTNQNETIALHHLDEIVLKLEGIKAKLLSLPTQQKTLASVIENIPVVAPKKQSAEKAKKAPDLPNLFDF